MPRDAVQVWVTGHAQGHRCPLCIFYGDCTEPCLWWGFAGLVVLGYWVWQAGSGWLGGCACRAVYVGLWEGLVVSACLGACGHRCLWVRGQRWESCNSTQRSIWRKRRDSGWWWWWENSNYIFSPNWNCSLAAGSLVLKFYKSSLDTYILEMEFALSTMIHLEVGKLVN